MRDITEFLNEQFYGYDEESNINEAAEIKSEKDFRAFVHAKLKEIHGDDYKEEEADKVADGVLADNKDLVDAGDWGALVGIVEKGVVK